MVNAEETKRFKAKQLRWKKPIVKDLNLCSITKDLFDIQEELKNQIFDEEKNIEKLKKKRQS